MISSEIGRVVRHMVVPLVTWMVSKGYLPDYARQDVIEALTLTIAFLLAYGWSRYRDYVAESAKLAAEQHASKMGGGCPVGDRCPKSQGQSQ